MMFYQKKYLLPQNGGRMETGKDPFSQTAADKRVSRKTAAAFLHIQGLRLSKIVQQQSHAHGKIGRAKGDGAAGMGPYIVDMVTVSVRKAQTGGYFRNGTSQHGTIGLQYRPSLRA